MEGLERTTPVAARGARGWFLDRSGAGAGLDFGRRLGGKLVPGNLSWIYTTGALALFFFGLQFFTGCLLLIFYVPDERLAHQSIQLIEHRVELGWLVRQLHSWGASFIVFVLVLHVLKVLWYGTYKRPREFTWFAGVLLLAVTLAFCFSGYLLPWNQLAYWATRVTVEAIDEVPVVGPGIKTLIVGAPEVSGRTLGRFFSLHVFVLPVLLVALALYHLYLISSKGMATKAPVGDELELGYRTVVRREGAETFFPRQVYRDLIACNVGFALLVTFAAFWPWEIGEPASLETPPGIKPEWYFLPMYQFLKYFDDKVTGLLCMGGAGLVFLLLPLLDRGNERRIGRRPLFAIAAATALVALVGLGVLGYLSERDVTVFGTTYHFDIRGVPRVAEDGGARGGAAAGKGAGDPHPAAPAPGETGDAEEGGDADGRRDAEATSDSPRDDREGGGGAAPAPNPPRGQGASPGEAEGEEAAAQTAVREAGAENEGAEADGRDDPAARDGGDAARDGERNQVPEGADRSGEEAEAGDGEAADGEERDEEAGGGEGGEGEGDGDGEGKDEEANGSDRSAEGGPDVPAAENAAGGVPPGGTCGECHEKQLEEWTGSVHAENRIVCVDCHGGRDGRPPDELLATFAPPPEESECVDLDWMTAEEWKLWVWAHAGMKRDRKGCPSPPSRSEIPEFCGSSCHVAVFQHFSPLHLEESPKKSCVNCHSNHDVEAAGESTWKDGYTRDDGEKGETFREVHAVLRGLEARFAAVRGSIGALGEIEYPAEPLQAEVDRLEKQAEELRPLVHALSPDLVREGTVDVRGSEAIGGELEELAREAAAELEARDDRWVFVAGVWLVVLLLSAVLFYRLRRTGPEEAGETGSVPETRDRPRVEPAASAGVPSRVRDAAPASSGKSAEAEEAERIARSGDERGALLHPLGEEEGEGEGEGEDEEDEGRTG